MIAVIAVGVATRRPPAVHRTLRIVVAVDAVDDLDPARTELAAELLACQWAACTPGVVMPVRSTIVELLAI